MFTTALGLPDLTEAQRSNVLTLRSDWTNAWTSICRELIAIERDAANPGLPMDGEFDMAAMQKKQSERKRVRFVRTEADERAARKLLELLTPEQATAVGELPEAPTSNFPIEFGDLEMIIGG